MRTVSVRVEEHTPCMFTGDATTTLVHDRQRARRAAAHDHDLAGRGAGPSWMGAVRVRAGRLLVQGGLRLASPRATGPVLDVTSRTASGSLVGMESCRSAAVLARVRC